MNPLYQRIITIVAGALAAYIAQHVAGVNEQHAADVLAAILMAFSAGWAARHPADAVQELPRAAIIQYEQLSKLGTNPAAPAASAAPVKEVDPRG